MILCKRGAAVFTPLDNLGCTEDTRNDNRSVFEKWYNYIWSSVLMNVNPGEPRRYPKAEFREQFYQLFRMKRAIVFALAIPAAFNGVESTADDNFPRILEGI